jgi:LytS/YehU family sensor histidine kinase
MVFLNDYFSLLKIRFEQAVQLQIGINPEMYDQYLIPPISLQILVENAIKHNEFTDAVPLVISIEMQHDELIIHNLVRKKILRKASSRIGLQNLSERYRLTTSKEIGVTESASDFTVSLPVLKIA